MVGTGMQTLHELLNSISAANLIDIGIIACLIYFVLVWFRETRAFQIMATLLGIGVFYFLASKGGLVLTSTLFQYLWAAIIVVLVIVFQPEIRQMLDRASPIRYLSGRHSNDIDSGRLEELVKAVAELARLRIGAIIVFQRLDRLDNLIISGKSLESLVSAEAIVMIFQKASPLHDGAILIWRDRIRAAGCILPLSRDEDLSSRYGTRHRAALGLTERSDALCVVVSEERGEVSLVKGKEITTFTKKADFQQALERGLMGDGAFTGPPAPGFYSLLISNWRLKGISVAIAVLLWFIVVGPQQSEVGMSIPIQYTNLPAGMEITGKWADRIDVRVRGSESSLANLGTRSVRAVVNLARVVPGLNYFRMSNKNLLVPPGITISQIRPSDLHLTIETASVKKIPVVPTMVGPIPENTKVVVKPGEVQVKALPEDLRKIASLTTDSIVVNELIAKGQVIVPVVIKPEGLKIDSVDPQQVTVTLETEQP
jgi:diadenylate cyclase